MKALAAALLLSVLAGQGSAHKPPSARRHLRALGGVAPHAPSVAALLAAIEELRVGGKLVGGDGSLLVGPSALSQLRDLVASIRAADVGVSAKTVKEKAAADPEYEKGSWYYQGVHDNDNVTVGIFMLPAGSSIPLHDHPGMDVVGRLLFGRMRVAQMDLVKPHKKLTSGLTVHAKLRSNEIHGPEPEALAVTPDFGNLHELEALDDVAFLDVIFPPYDEKAGRDCSFFEGPLQMGSETHQLKVK